MSTNNGKATKASEDLEQLRLEVVKQELSTRSWVAMRDKMRATLDIEDMRVLYDKVVEDNNTRLKSQQEAYEKAMNDAMSAARAQQNPAPEAPVIPLSI